MNSTISLEKVLYKSTDNHDLYYPTIGKDEFTYMVTEFSASCDQVVCFLFVRGIGIRYFIDIYVWDIMLADGYKRFVLEQGYALPEDEEEMFLKYLHDDIRIEDTLYEHFIAIINEKYPEIHLKSYADRRQTLLHVYYTFHRTGPYEILFKANLNFLAKGLGRVDEYNLIGSSPEKIFDVQLGMLHAMNSDFGSEVLENVENRKWARYLYERHHSLIHGSMVNKYQWRYMKEQEEEDALVDKRMYRFLGALSSDRDYYTYLKYRRQKQLVDEYYSILPQYPEEADLEEHSKVCDMIEWYIENEWGIDSCLSDKVRKYKDIYSFETDEYIVMMPTSLRELLNESQNQHNCLFQYVLRMACESTIILFMREKRKVYDSLITIEVKNGVIKQARGAYNCSPDEKQKKFLKDYAEIKKLSVIAF